jgi:DNA-binding response OmpR family regulator
VTSTVQRSDIVLPQPVAPRILEVLGIDAAPIVAPPITLWPAEGQCFVAGRRVPLNRREFELLVALAAAAGHVVPRTGLYRMVWGHEMAYRQRDVDVYVRKLRVRLTEAAPDWSFIHTHPKFGYRFWPEKLP